MIASIRGRITHKSTESVIVEANGLGYELFIPLSTFYMLPGHGEDVNLRVYTHVREDAIQLYGFLTQEEKDVFLLLIGVSGVGPKLARNILSGVAVVDLVQALGTSDKAKLNSIPGIGAKSAERLILELKDKIGSIALKAAAPMEAASNDPLTVDVASALENLGYKSAQAEEAARKAIKALGSEAAFETVLKESLKLLSKK
ncbi:MAG TPA: Holliday junction branch migration protein RuvA [Deltaproteobacteria bacterium]|nr:MAG: Holliday junction DNA helicase RuvA [Deltaproteobacteria bacterium GWA2_55_82]OGQ63295.1 MAG: Holliday junction DNA helicase RuvA [Deltaproteobacteria bacterium RIFCSPLOWO2_02_FULL_55_12]OIJ73131.1 MAG: Holliday junction DNA helicase RuvA [Deltaproteobacteria bacterium GWC2_55_46]HBG47901.1 Holliday junction branch migration protein RuvA [Deltaproteobacteria bacterium]HCY11836.1 Holliday junction branch migration protein RuvA [Deltaproteobacteria bacterium]